MLSQPKVDPVPCLMQKFEQFQIGEVDYSQVPPLDYQPREFQNRNFVPRQDFNFTQYQQASTKNWGSKPVMNIRRPNNGTYQPKMVKAQQEVNMKSFENIPVSQSGPDWTPIDPLELFTDMEGLNESLAYNIKSRGYVQPTPVQKYALKIISSGRDLMACAQTGSGKTAAFLLPIFNMMIQKEQIGSVIDSVARPLLLILAPTRELCCQIHDEANKFARGTSIKTCVVYGGAPVANQRAVLSRGVHVLVATPGRLIDLLQQRCINLGHVKYLVFDEADRMLDMGFEPQIRQVVTDFQMPPTTDRQTLMFSATFPKEIQTLAADFMNSYIFLSVGRVGSTNENITQEIIAVEEHDKENLIVHLLRKEEPGNLVLIFVATKRGADELCQFLNQRQFSVSAIHGARDQSNRHRALNMFRDGRTPVLVATAVASRGLDIPNVRHVINFDLPTDIEEYVHRIGRTGRIGADGRATSFYNSSKNRNVAPRLVSLLHEAKQSVPDFLSNDARYGGSGGGYNSYNNRGGGRRSDQFGTWSSSNGRMNRGSGGGNSRGSMNSWSRGGMGTFNASNGGAGMKNYDYTNNNTFNAATAYNNGTGMQQPPPQQQQQQLAMSHDSDYRTGHQAFTSFENYWQPQQAQPGQQQQQPPQNYLDSNTFNAAQFNGMPTSQAAQMYNYYSQQQQQPTQAPPSDFRYPPPGSNGAAVMPQQRAATSAGPYFGGQPAAPTDYTQMGFYGGQQQQATQATPAQPVPPQNAFPAGAGNAAVQVRQNQNAYGAYLDCMNYN